MMKRVALAILLIFAGQAVAQQVRVTVQVIEVPHGELTKWTTGGKLRGPEIHERALKLVAAGGAEILDTSVVVTRNTEKATIESIAEVMYPVEQEPSSMAVPSVPLDARKYYPPPPRPWAFNSFATRNAGTIVEVEPTVSPDNKLVDLRLAYEMVDRASLATWMEFRDELGDGSIRKPIFDTRRLTNSLTVEAGSFELFNVFTPKPPAAPAVATRQLVFVRAEVMKLPKP